MARGETIHSTTPQAQRVLGTIHRLVPDRGFGFIAVEGVQEHVFFHRSALTNIRFEQLLQGMTVEFEYGTAQNRNLGPRAEHVTKMEGRD